MMEHGRDDFQIVSDCIQGLRSVDQTALESAEILSERLDRLKKASVLFDQISPSPHFAVLSGKQQVTTIC